MNRALLPFLGAVLSFTPPHTFGETATPHVEPHATPHAEPAVESHAATVAEPTVATAAVVAPPSVAEEIASLLRIGDQKTIAQDWASAVLAYNQVLVAGRAATPAQMRSALLGLARAYRGDLRLTQASAVYERYLKTYPDDENRPIVYLELGRCLRALGAHRLAIARFYSVLNSTLKLPQEGPDNYRQLARTAQFEIAETYFQSGDYEQAFRFFSRVRLLDLAPNDRARATFKAAYALNLKGDDDQAVIHLRSYLSLYPDGDDAAETRHLLALALHRLGRRQESLAATFELLQIESSRTAADPKAWSHWQRKTGNHLANSFYEEGDILTALAIYECLLELGGPPEWLLPVRYQIALCQERLQQPALARATYQTILDALQTPPSNEDPIPGILRDIGAMVAWRLKHLAWLESTGKQSSLLIAAGVASHSPPPYSQSVTP